MVVPERSLEKRKNRICACKKLREVDLPDADVLKTEFLDLISMDTEGLLEDPEFKSFLEPHDKFNHTFIRAVLRKVNEN